MKLERMITEKMIMRKMIIRTCFLFCYANMTPPLVPAVGSPWSLSSSHPSPIQSQCLRSIFSHFFSIFLCSFEKYPFQIYEMPQHFSSFNCLCPWVSYFVQICLSCVDLMSNEIAFSSHILMYVPLHQFNPLYIVHLPVKFCPQHSHHNIPIIISIIIIIIISILTTLAATASIQFTPLLCTLSSVPFKLCP